MGVAERFSLGKIAISVQHATAVIGAEQQARSVVFYDSDCEEKWKFAFIFVIRLTMFCLAISLAVDLFKSSINWKRQK